MSHCAISTMLSMLLLSLFELNIFPLIKLDFLDSLYKRIEILLFLAKSLFAFSWAILPKSLASALVISTT